MVLGLIKNYGSKIWEGIKSKGHSIGGFLKEYHQPILGAIEGATGILKQVPHPVISPIAGIINTGLKSMKNKVDDVPNEDVKKQLKEIQNEVAVPVTVKKKSKEIQNEVAVPVTVKKKSKEIQKDSPHSSEQLTPVSQPDPKTIINPTFDVITRTPSVTVKPIIGAFQHNILKGKAVPYDLMRFTKKHMKQKND